MVHVGWIDQSRQVSAARRHRKHIRVVLIAQGSSQILKFTAAASRYLDAVTSYAKATHVVLSCTQTLAIM